MPLCYIYQRLLFASRRHQGDYGGPNHRLGTIRYYRWLVWEDESLLAWWRSFLYQMCEGRWSNGGIGIAKTKRGNPKLTNLPTKLAQLGARDSTNTFWYVNCAQVIQSFHEGKYTLTTQFWHARHAPWIRPTRADVLPTPTEVRNSCTLFIAEHVLLAQKAGQRAHRSRPSRSTRRACFFSASVPLPAYLVDGLIRSKRDSPRTTNRFCFMPLLPTSCGQQQGHSSRPAR